MTSNIEQLEFFWLNILFKKHLMSTETLTKLNPKILINSKLDPNGSGANVSDPKMSNTELNKVHQTKKIKSKICINKLKNRLKIEEKTKKIENRILTGLFLGVVAVLFFVAT